MDGSDHLGKTVGPSPGCPWHFATRGWKRLALDHKSCEGRGSEEPQSRTTCRDLLGEAVGPGRDALDTSRLAARRGWSSIFRVARGKEARSLIAHQVSTIDGWLRSPRQELWARGLDALDTSRLVAGRGWSLIIASNHAPRVPLRWTAEIFSVVPWAYH
jgi:hypothetical protein